MSLWVRKKSRTKKCKQPTESKSWSLSVCLQGYAAKPSLFIFTRKSPTILTNIPNPLKRQVLPLFIECISRMHSVKQFVTYLGKLLVFAHLYFFPLSFFVFVCLSGVELYFTSWKNWEHTN